MFLYSRFLEAQMPKNIAKSARKNTDNLPKDADRFHATSAAFRASMVETEGRAKDKSARARARKVPSATVTSAAAAAVLQAPEPLVPKRNGKSTKFSSLLPLTPTPSAIMSSGNERAGPSGYQKKARTISSTKFLQVTSGGGGAEVVEMGSSSQPDSDSSRAAAVGAGIGSSSVVTPIAKSPCTPTRPRGKAGKSDAAAMPPPPSPGPSPRRTPKRKSLDIPAILPGFVSSCLCRTTSHRCMKCNQRCCFFCRAEGEMEETVCKRCSPSHAPAAKKSRRRTTKDDK